MKVGRSLYPKKQSNELPLPHRAVMHLGLLMVIFWIVFQMMIPVSDLLIPHFAERTQNSSIAILVIGTIFVVFGFVCEMILGAIDQRRSRRDERERIADLSGRSRLDR